MDERYIVVERFGGRLHSVGLLDSTTAGPSEQWDLLSSDERSITNPRVSPDGRWIAFDAARPGGPPTVFVAALRLREAIAPADWMVVEPVGEPSVLVGGRHPPLLSPDDLPAASSETS